MAGTGTPVEKSKQAKPDSKASVAGRVSGAARPAPGSRPAPADEELAARLRVAVTRLNRRLRHESLAGVSPAQASALGAVHRLGDPTLGELAIDEQVQPPTMTRLVASLEAAGLVDRHHDATDGRVVRVRLTAEGRRCMERVRTLKTAFLSRGLAALSPQERGTAAKLTALLERLVDER